MKILLTGSPHVGKSTLLGRLVRDMEHVQGFMTTEILQNNQRCGFELLSSNGGSIPFAHEHSTSSTRVSRYGVDIGALDTVADSLSNIEPGTLLYIDEIGQMQLHSEKFTRLTNQFLAADNDFIGTISSVFRNDYAESILANPSVEIIEVTPHNRNQLAIELRKRIKFS
ncbi:hypothetical protein E6P97_00070 [Patescibacteria group bacterium]|nr:MAG: hypothetical protein E6P97_00070 [Patescibacteria group bacterium]